MKKLKYSLLFLLMSFCVSVFAQTSPIPMLQNTSNEMISALQKNKTALKTNSNVVYGLVRRILLPHVDATGMARSVLGRSAWTNATPAQQQRFTKEFVTLLVRTYSAAFANYSDQSVQFSPVRGDMNGQFIQVDSQVIRKEGPAIPISYRLIWLGNEWKVYDFSVEGVSMLQSFRSQFAAQLSQGNLDSLIQQLAQHNAKPQHFGS